MKGGECWERGGGESEKRKGPKVYREVVKTVCKVLFTEAL